MKHIQIDAEKLVATPVGELKAFEIVKSILQKSGQDISKLNYKHGEHVVSGQTELHAEAVLNSEGKPVEIRVFRTAAEHSAE